MDGGIGSKVGGVGGAIFGVITPLSYYRRMNCRVRERQGKYRREGKGPKRGKQASGYSSGDGMKEEKQ